MSFQDVAFLPSRASFSPHFLKIVVEVKVSGPPHVLTLCLGVSKGIPPARYSCFTKPLLCHSNLMEIIRVLTKMR